MMKQITIQTALNGFIVEYGWSGPKEIFKTFDEAAQEARLFLCGDKKVPDPYATVLSECKAMKDDK